jgi:uncharacterized membrane protein
LVKSLARWALGLALVFAGFSHLSFLRAEFQAQVPAWLPLDADFVVVASGVIEIALGLGLIALKRYRAPVGLATAAFFIAIFPGNIAQWLEGRDAFGLSTDEARLTRLFFQPLLVLWALWCTGVFPAVKCRSKRSRRSPGAENQPV